MKKEKKKDQPKEAFPQFLSFFKKALAQDTNCNVRQALDNETLYSPVQAIFILLEAVRRLWDELEGHQDMCAILKSGSTIEEEVEKFRMGFSFKPKLHIYPKVKHGQKDKENRKRDKKGRFISQGTRKSR
jgi:hypothetical protein